MVRIIDTFNPGFRIGALRFHQNDLVQRWSISATQTRQDAEVVRDALLTTLDRLHQPEYHLHMLDLSGSGLTTLPPVTILQHLEGITILDVRDNALPGEELEKLTALTSLTQLYLSDNPLQAIPLQALSRQENLLIFEADRCCLKTFPDDLLTLSRLDTLGLQGNPLCQLPENLGYRLPHLAELDIRDTGIRALPDSLRYLYELKVLQSPLAE